MGQDTPAKNGRAAPTVAGKTLAETLNEAIAAHRAGRLSDAERIYQAILGVKPDHFDSLHMLGVVHL